MASISELDFETGVFDKFSVFARKSFKLSGLKNTMDYFLDLFSTITTSEIWKNLNSIHPDLLGTDDLRKSVIELRWLSELQRYQIQI